MELWDLYDMHREKTHKQMIRGKDIPKDLYHLIIHVCIFNTKGEMLIQQRQSFKEGWPNMWDITVGGSAIASETTQDAAHRELFEELGIDLSFWNVRPNLTISFSRGFDDIFLVEKDIDLQTLNLQFEEVQAAKWATQTEIFEMIKQNQFLPYYPSLIQLFFDTRKQYGCHKNNEDLT